jgi:hypothetical protein
MKGKNDIEKAVSAQVPLDFATQVCNLFAQLGARGSSIMFSSGDDGVGGGTCVNNDGSNVRRFQPNFPASCPFVTTVSRLRLLPRISLTVIKIGGRNNQSQPRGCCQLLRRWLFQLFRSPEARLRYLCNEQPILIIS